MQQTVNINNSNNSYEDDDRKNDKNRMNRKIITMKHHTNHLTERLKHFFNQCENHCHYHTPPLHRCNQNHFDTNLQLLTILLMTPQSQHKRQRNRQKPTSAAPTLREGGLFDEL